MPFKNQLHVDQLLSNISVKYKNADYIGDRVFPSLPVKTDSNLYRIFERNFRVPTTKRANKGLAREHQFEVSTASYILQNHAIRDFISDDDLDNYDAANLRADTTEELIDVILRRREVAVAELFTTTSWSLNVSLASANAFSANTILSNPIPVFLTGATEIIQNSGHKPNFGILPRDGWVACVNHTSVLDRIKYVSKEVSTEMLAALFDVGELLVPTAQQDTSALGATSVISSIWGDSAFVGFKPERASAKSPSCGYMFQKEAPSVKRYREEAREGEWIEVSSKFVPKVVSSLSGFLIKDII